MHGVRGTQGAILKMCMEERALAPFVDAWTVLY